MKLNKELLVMKLKTILTPDELERINIHYEERPRIIVDVHGLICIKARRLIDNIINLLQISFVMIVVHGYNHGTAIKDMLAYNYSNPHVCSKSGDLYNQGITYLQII